MTGFSLSLPLLFVFFFLSGMDFSSLANLMNSEVVGWVGKDDAWLRRGCHGAIMSKAA